MKILEKLHDEVILRTHLNILVPKALSYHTGIYELSIVWNRMILSLIPINSTCSS